MVTIQFTFPDLPTLPLDCVLCEYASDRWSMTGIGSDKPTDLETAARVWMARGTDSRFLAIAELSEKEADGWVSTMYECEYDQTTQTWGKWHVQF